MTCRGRGCLEIKPSPNPFFQPTSADVGVKPNEEIVWKVNGKEPPFNSSAQKSDGNFLFLYTRESDVIGAKVQKPVVQEKKLLTKTEFLKKKREMLELTKTTEGTYEDTNDLETTGKMNVETLLENYKHVPKAEDPRYTTSNVSHHNQLFE